MKGGGGGRGIGYLMCFKESVDACLTVITATKANTIEENDVKGGGGGGGGGGGMNIPANNVYLRISINISCW